MTINAGGRLWQVNNYEGEYLGPIDLAQRDRVLRQLGLRAADERSSAPAADVVGPRRKQLGDSRGDSPLNGYFSIGLGGEPATPLEMARAYAAFANGGYRIDGAIFGERAAGRRVPARRTRRLRRSRTPSFAGRCSSRRRRRRSIDQLLQGVVRYGTGPRPRFPAAPVAGKTARPRTTATPGSSATRRDSSTAVWVGYPDKLGRWLTEFHGEPVAGGTYPGADLEGVHGARRSAT